MNIITILITNLLNSHSSLDLLIIPYKASTIAAVMTAIAGSPKGCALNEEANSPRKAESVAVVSPHEGHAMPVKVFAKHGRYSVF